MTGPPTDSSSDAPKTPDVNTKASPLLVRPRLGLGEAWWIAAAPALGYLLSFAYESGYVSRFNIPFWVVRPDISHALFALTTVGFGLFLIQNTLAVLPNRPWWVFLMPFFGVLVGISMCLFFVFATKWYLGAHLILPIIGIGFGIAFAISTVRDYVFVPLRTYSGLPSVWDRWKARFARDRGKPASNAIEGMLDFDRSGRMWGWYLFLLVLGFCSTLAHEAGRFSARTTFEFALRGGPSPCIVIRRYGDNLICVGVDTTHNAVLDSFSMLSVSDSLTFSNRVFGALKFPEDQKKGHLFGSP